MIYEIFNPMNGKPIVSVPFAILAKTICRFNNSLDYAKKGDGWV